MPAPSARRLAAGAAVATTAVFGVLAVRVRAGHDPALGAATPAPASSDGTTQQATPGYDPYGTQSEPYGVGGYQDGYGAGGDDSAQDGAGDPGAGVPSDGGGGTVAAPVTRGS
jgi:hypothetical protein